MAKPAISARGAALVRRRIVVAACAFCLWAAGIEVRLVYLQVFSTPTCRLAPSASRPHDHGAGQERRNSRSSRPGARLQRRRRFHLRRPA